MVLLKYDIYKNLESVKTVGKYSRHKSYMKEIENNKQINESSSSGSFLLVFQNFHEMLIGGKFCSGPPEVKKPLSKPHSSEKNICPSARVTTDKHTFFSSILL